MERHTLFKYKNIVADAGYESEENYVFLERNGQIGYIKPQNYELSKTRNFKNDINRREDMDYDPKSNTYVCRNGKKLSAASTKAEKLLQDMNAKSQYMSAKTVMTVLTRRAA